MQSRNVEVHQEIQKCGENNELQQGQIDFLAGMGISHSFNLHGEAERRRAVNDALTTEISDRKEHEEALQARVNSLEEVSVQNTLNLQEEAEQRRMLQTKTLSFIDGQKELNEYLQHEAKSCRENDEILQTEISDNTDANLQQSLNLAHEAEKRREIEEVVAGIKSPVDWSQSESLAINEPRCAVVNFTGLKSMPTSKTAEVPAIMEFWDMQGNFFRKKIICSAQGSSSLSYVKKNVKFDLLNEDGSEFNLKIGNWVVQDSFHLKAYYTDFFRGVGVTSYKLWEEIMQTKPFKKALVNTAGMNPTANGAGNVSDLSLQIDTGALCHPDGFPCIVYLNGTFYGIYSWQIKKQRKNYHMDKSTVEHIHLDGSLYTYNFWNGTINWSAFEIRNPNKLYCMDGKKYNGDAPRELIDETSEKYDPDDKNHARSAKVKRYIQSLVQRFNALKQTYSAYKTSDPDRVKAEYEEIFDVENMRDYLIFSDVIKNSDGFGKNWQWTTYDGKKWYVNAYALDMSFGGYFTGTQITAPLTNHITTSTALPFYYVALLYKNELEDRYKFLRESEVIDVEHIVSKLSDWTARIGQSNYELEYERWPNSPCILHYKDSVDRVRKWLTVEISNMDKLYHYESRQEEIERTVKQTVERVNVLEEAAAETERATLKAANDLSLIEGYTVTETQERSGVEKGLQAQLTTLGDICLHHELELRTMRIALKEWVKAAGVIYQTAADTGNLTYKGAKVASGNEVDDMLKDILSGNDSDWIKESEIPEVLRDQISNPEEVSEMLSEIFSR